MYRLLFGPAQELSMSRPLPNTSQRHHTHSISLGALNPNHRVTRRKSVTTAAANAAAVAASMEGGEATSLPMGAHRRALGGRKGLESGSIGNVSGFSSYLSRSINSSKQESSVARKSSPGSDNSDGKPDDRNRRASEGAQLKTEGKRASTAIRCDRCGKGYKHGSCLSKHMCVSPLPLGRLLLARSGICTMSALCRSPSWLFNFPSSLPPLFFPIPFSNI